MELTPLNRRQMLGVLAAGSCATAISPVFAEPSANALVVVVMDPLSARLACACVKGYAQRDYGKLANHLESKLGRPVALAFAESLPAALKKTGGRADLVIGKHSVVVHAGRPLTCVASLTGADGQTTQTGLVLVPAKDPAKAVADLKGYRLLLGPAEAEEKRAAAVALFAAAGVPVSAPEECETCTEAATKLVDLGPEAKVAAVVSSHNEPLLLGCGTVDKGALRVVGKTAPLPFVTAWVADALPAADRSAITAALFAIGADQTLCQALETRDGFVAADREGKKKA